MNWNFYSSTFPLNDCGCECEECNVGLAVEYLNGRIDKVQDNLNKAILKAYEEGYKYGKVSKNKSKG